jgi:hypothetical protein
VNYRVVDGWSVCVFGIARDLINLLNKTVSDLKGCNFSNMANSIRLGKPLVDTVSFLFP